MLPHSRVRKDSQRSASTLLCVVCSSSSLAMPTDPFYSQSVRHPVRQDFDSRAMFSRGAIVEAEGLPPEDSPRRARSSRNRRCSEGVYEAGADGALVAHRRRSVRLELCEQSLLGPDSFFGVPAARASSSSIQIRSTCSAGAITRGSRSSLVRHFFPAAQALEPWLIAL